MISVVVLSWNGKEHLEVCLSSLSTQSFQDFEIILVDNGSTDGSIDYVRERFPKVRLVPLVTNLGFCAGNNVGIESAQGDLIALLNNDTEVSPNWLESLYEAAQRSPEAGFFASKMLLFDRRDTIDSAGDEFHTAGFASKRGWLQPDGPEFAQEKDVFGACAGAALYRHEMLDEVGLLDEDFYANGEDVDLSFRAHAYGYRCLYVPTARVYHKGGATIGQTEKWFYLMRRNQLWIVVKNMPNQLLFRYLPNILVYNITSLLYHSLQGRGGLIWRAYFDAARGLPGMLEKRRLIQSARAARIKDIDSILSKATLFARARSPITKKLSSSYRLR